MVAVIGWLLIPSMKYDRFILAIVGAYELRHAGIVVVMVITPATHYR